MARWETGESQGFDRPTSAHAAEVTEAVRRLQHRYSRLLHDRALQTLEILSASAEIRDPELRRFLVAEASWLRGLVEDGVTSSPADLLTALAECLAVRPPGVLYVELAPVPPRLPTLCPDVVDAAAGAVTEALNNAAKHAMATRAVVSVLPVGDVVLVRVTDDGRGMPAEPVHIGFGLRHSIRGRMAAVGGQARVSSAQGVGTQIELVCPTLTVVPRQAVA